MRIPASLHWVLRLCGGILLGTLGWAASDLVPRSALPAPLDTPLLFHSLVTVILGVVGIIFFPWLLAPPLNALIERLSHMSVAQIIADFIGVVTGLAVGALIAIPLGYLPDPFRQVLPLVTALIFANIGFLLMNARYREIFAALNFRLRAAPRSAEDVAARGKSEGDNEQDLPEAPARERLLLDTSVIIDGRIADICTTGFVRGELIVPRFVLAELQRIADSSDGLRRARGRRGLEVLKRLQKESLAPVLITDDDARAREVDEKLVMLAKEHGWLILTNDFNLNKVASLQGAQVLNINELANAVKAVVLPGESLQVQVIQRGKDYDQGVGYLEDGTMVVVEGGGAFLEKTLDVTVTKVLQTAAGRMIFAKP